ncbi:hypothetical protein K7I13_01130 [Brucepastera parasyntrophica]|uniref:hypothetical protein n=1 Tax=Brucepastera parasyntrophica TaxID=2880008 RepID=UPI00210BBD96|nr:hypothetical protein [Brucepastera parasyntrophica]ULQ59975.1 hypothetical protein K7I13_01130 [Brucepastera parasyntrophica]
MKYDGLFWNSLEKLISENEIIIDRPKGSRHPKYPDLIYQVDYGYITNTRSMDNNGIDIFVGTAGNGKIDAVVCIIDLLKKDSEIKYLAAEQRGIFLSCGIGLGFNTMELTKTNVFVKTTQSRQTFGLGY